MKRVTKVTQAATAYGKHEAWTAVLLLQEKCSSGQLTGTLLNTIFYDEPYSSISGTCHMLYIFHGHEHFWESRLSLDSPETQLKLMGTAVMFDGAEITSSPKPSGSDIEALAIVTVQRKVAAVNDSLIPCGSDDEVLLVFVVDAQRVEGMRNELSDALQSQ